MYMCMRLGIDALGKRPCLMRPASTHRAVGTITPHSPLFGASPTGSTRFLANSALLWNNLTHDASWKSTAEGMFGRWRRPALCSSAALAEGSLMSVLRLRGSLGSPRRHHQLSCLQWCSWPCDTPPQPACGGLQVVGCGSGILPEALLGL